MDDKILAVDMLAIVRDSPSPIKCAHHENGAQTPQFTKFVGIFVGMRRFQ